MWQFHKQFTIALHDGDNEILTLKVDTSLNRSMSLVEKGGLLLHLLVFVPIYFGYSDPADLNVIILLVLNFRKIAQMVVDPKLAFKGKERRLQVKAAMPPPSPDPHLPIASKSAAS